MAGSGIDLYRNYTDSDTTSVHLSDTSATLPTAEDLGWSAPSGYRFKEWNSKRDGTGISYEPGTAYPTDTYIKYAIWEQLIIDVMVTYEGENIIELSESDTKTLKTQGKYLTDDIVLKYMKSGGGGGGTSKTVTIKLTNPKHTGEAGAPACFIYESDDGSDCTQIGSISSPTGSTTVTVSKNLCLVEPNSSFWSAGNGSTLYDAYVIQDPLPQGRAFYVFGDAQLTVSGIDYDD